MCGLQVPKFPASMDLFKHGSLTPADSSSGKTVVGELTEAENRDLYPLQLFDKPRTYVMNKTPFDKSGTIDIPNCILLLQGK